MSRNFRSSVYSDDTSEFFSRVNFCTVSEYHYLRGMQLINKCSMHYGKINEPALYQIINFVFLDILQQLV